MFERFTRSARQVVIGAQEAAVRRGDDVMGTEHLLLALASSGSSVGALLVERGAGPGAVETAVDAVSGGRRRRLADLEERDRDALAALGIDVDRVRESVERTFGPGALDRAAERHRRPSRRDRWRRRWAERGGRRPVGRTVGGRRPVSRDAKVTLELALRQSLRLRSGEIGEEHLALGLLMRDGTGAARALAHLGVATDELRGAIEGTLRRSA